MAFFNHLDRYKDFALLLVKYGRSDLVKKIGIDIPFKEDENTIKTAKELIEDLQRMGPTYIKLGQLFSTQFDIFPPPFKEALETLQDKVDFFPFEEVERIFLEELHVSIKDAFIEFDRKPLAAASLSQVHHAVLHSGKVVAVKIQRPGIQKQIFEDIEMLEELAIFLDHNNLAFLGIDTKHFYWKDKIDTFRKSLLNELDFRKEANNLITFRRNLRKFKHIIIPSPIKSYTSERVLTMEYISTNKIIKLHPLVMMDLDGEKLAKTLFAAYLKQIFVDGFVHIDPHPGNVYLSNENELVLLDLGMVDNLSPQLQQDFLHLLWAISEGRGEDAADTIIKMGHMEEGFKHYKFRSEIVDLIAQQQHLNWEQMAMGSLIIKVAQNAGKYGLHLPSKFNSLGKTLMNLDAVVRALSPTFNPNAFMRNSVSYFFKLRMKQFFSKTSFYRLLLETGEVLQKLPSKANNLLEMLANNEFKIRIQALDENRLMTGFEKVANRIALGLVLASLIIGAALLMRVETAYTLFGYPLLAILLFLAAAIGGVIFVINILLHDRSK